VYVLTRETDRFDVSMALLEFSPKRLFFEKPLVARQGQAKVTEQDFFDARLILQTAAEKGCETAMIFNYRFFDQSITARQICTERGFGSVINVMGLVHYACWSHAIDLVHFFAGPLSEICALQSRQPRTGAGIEALDVSATFRTEEDATGTLIGTAGLSWDFSLFELIFNLEGGRIHFRGLDGDMEVLDVAGKRHETLSIPRDRSRWDQYSRSFEKSIAAYLNTLREGKAPPVPGIAGLRELQVEAGIKRSIAQSKPVVLAEEFPLALCNRTVTMSSS
jgi:predicted dehydrogenase